MLRQLFELFVDGRGEIGTSDAEFGQGLRLRFTVASGGSSSTLSVMSVTKLHRDNRKERTVLLL